MRDEIYTDEDYAFDAAAPRAGRLTAALGATAAVALLAGLVVWSYRLGVRDAHEVPVIRAMVGEVRVAPTDPGGLQVDHQERRVYDAPAAPATVELAPPPEPLAAEDLAAGRLATQPATAVPAGAPADAEPPAPAAAPPRGIDDLVVAALAAPGPAGEARSPLPPARPGAVPRPVAVSASVDSTPAATGSSPFGPGTPAIQLGAYLSAEVAQTMWRALAARNGDLLAGRQPVVDTIVGSTRTLHALRAAPFATTAEAEGLCAALRARSEDCLVTELR